MTFECTRCTIFRGADSDTEHYLVIVRVKERLAGKKQATQISDGVRFDVRKLSELEVRKQYQIEISNRFAVLKNFTDSEDINWALENTENIKI